MKKYVVVLAGFLLIFFVIASFIVLIQGPEKEPLYFQAAKWAEGAAPAEYIDACTLPLENEIVSLAKTAATDGPVIISKSSPIMQWADEIMEDSPFDMTDIRTAENEYYHIEFR